MKYLIALFFGFFLTGCATQQESVMNGYQNYQKKNSAMSYYSYAQTINGLAGGYAANTTQEKANNAAINFCKSYTGQECVVAYENNNYVKNDNLYKYDVQIRKNEMNKYVVECEAFGFKRNTNKIASCALEMYKTEKRIAALNYQALAMNKQANAADTVANLALLQQSLQMLQPPAPPRNNNMRCTYNTVGAIGNINCF